MTTTTSVDAEPGIYDRMKGAYARSLLGFWIYLMTDTVLFGSLFATYVVLQGNTAGGPGAGELFSLPFVLGETVVLLTSSFTAGLMLTALARRDRYHTLWWLSVTALLGAAFLAMEMTEFAHLLGEGHGWWTSGFLTAFFTLLGTHGLHVAAGLVWALALAIQLLHEGINEAAEKRLLLFSLFWHFLDVIWIAIFTVVYLLGVAA